MTKTKGAATVGGARSIDWDAVERDYRTTRMTDTELSDKYGVSREGIVRCRNRQRKSDPSRWQRDLAPEVRRATNALLLKETVTQQITEAHTHLTNAVISAAEINKQVVLKHRGWLSSLAQDAATMRAKMLTMVDSVADVREAAVAVGAIEALTRTTKTLIEKERQAFSLDDEASKPAPPRESVDWESIPPADRQAAFMRMVGA